MKEIDKYQKSILLEQLASYSGIVTPTGNGAHIIFKKKYIGKRVRIIIE